MVRIATENDSDQLRMLNEEFNGPSEATIESIRESLLRNQQEVVIVGEEAGALTGFICIQLKKSFCYKEYMPEITELYIRPAHRRQGIASRMIAFAEDYCAKHYPLHKFELLTGDDNLMALSVYSKLGYADDGEVHLSKQTEQ